MILTQVVGASLHLGDVDIAGAPRDRGHLRVAVREVTTREDPGDDAA